MKQIIQSFKTGETIIEETPIPNNSSGNILIQTTHSLVSLGTEKMLVEFGKSSLISKARQQPEKVKQVLDKIKTDGLIPTIETVFKKLEEPIPLGYCNVGIVREVGKNVNQFSVGDRVVSNGSHAEYVSVPQNLCAKIPDSVSDEEATFTVISSIGLQGIRLLDPKFGELVVVYGLGLIGLISAQILKNSGCKVIGVDIDQSKINLAKEFGIIGFNPNSDGDLEKHVKNLTDNNGADSVLITASAKGNEIISNSAKICRKKGKVVLVGVVGLNINRADFYEKEILFQVSCSYGPGRYDDNYEGKGIDYPYPYVRWTENRNFQAILEGISNRTIEVKKLITQKENLDDFRKIYDNLDSKNNIASVITYDLNQSGIPSKLLEISSNSFQNKKAKPTIGIIGAGNYTKMTMLPLLHKHKSQIKYIASQKGLSGTLLAKKYNVANSTTDFETILKDENIDIVLVTTRHNTHSHFVKKCLEADKNVFVEKPLALDIQELNSIITAKKSSNKAVYVGFNRRFSPHTIKVKNKLGKSPISVIANMNAGFIPNDVWVHDLKIGGGRIIGEACHLIDLISYLSNSKVKSVSMMSLGISPKANTDSASIHLKYQNGSLGVINYFSNGSNSYPKERVEVYQDNKTFVIDNFKKTKGYGVKCYLKTRLDKGHSNMFKSLINLKENETLIEFDSLVNTSKASFAAIESLNTNSWINID